MYLIEVEFYSWHDMQTVTKAEYIKDNYAIFRIADADELHFFVDESNNRDEVKKITIYNYDMFAMTVFDLAN